MPKRKPKDRDRSPDLPKDWIQRHIERLSAMSWYDPIELDTWEFKRSRLVGPAQYAAIDDEWREMRVGDTWGGPETTVHFRRQLTIPPSHADSTTYLDIDMDGGETQLSINGQPWQGLDHFRSVVPLGELAVAGAELRLEMEAFSVNYPYDERRNDKRDFHLLKRANLVLRDPVIEACVFDLAFVLDAYLHYWHQEEASEIEAFLLTQLESACRILGPVSNDRKQARSAAAEARKLLRERVFESPFYKHNGTISTIAHSHLDIVYLWPLKETLRKNGRTTSNALSLLREYPDYAFSQSQPYLYEQLGANYPQLLDEVRSMINAGRWETVGAMYVEPDGNLPGAESWVRQILFGKRVLRDTLGTDSRVCWLPDVFGVMHTLPQILKRAGIDYFLTAKLNIWNDTNEFPYDSFRWRSPDGSEVIAHFPPTHFAQDYTYANLNRHWQDYAEKFTARENLFIYGWGDGGGGPTRQMAEYGRRARNMPGLPAVQESQAETFFDRLRQKKDLLPIWDDELYMEGHRGTYTTRAALKRHNRKAELLYRDVEVLSSLLTPFAGPRIQERLNEGWKLLLLNQFHDTLPGTHVSDADPDIQQDYARVFATGIDLRDELLRFAIEGLDDRFDGLVINTLSARVTMVCVDTPGNDIRSVRLAGGEQVALQQDGDRSYFEASLPSMGWLGVEFLRDTCPAPQAPIQFSAGQIDTPFYRITLDVKDGRILQIHDKQYDRDVLNDAGNVFQVFEDDPGRKFGGWDVAYHLEEYAYPVELAREWQLVASGPVFARFAAEWSVLGSSIAQEMVVYTKQRRIDFHTRVNWQDEKKLLKVAFELAIRSRVAAYDLPFGHIERPTHRNTGWEQAKFEVSGHQWADMSEGDYGVALLNDCKYGYDARENVLRLTLLRSPVHPYRGSDIGEHQFSYALLPHTGGWRDGRVDAAACDFNSPAMFARQEPSAGARTIPECFSLLSLDGDTATIEVIKQAEDGNGLILRVFDTHGTHARVRVVTEQPLAHVDATDLLEATLEQVTVQEGFELRFSPYEIKTLRLRLQG